jgi:RimJ/RimL family protein N-acetyltransferase
MEETDLDAYTGLLGAPEVRQALQLSGPPSRREAWLEMVRWRGQWELRGSGHFAVEDRATGRLLKIR